MSQSDSELFDSEPKPIGRESPIFLGRSKTSLFNRLGAKGVDGIIVVAIFFIGRGLWHHLGWILSAGYAGLMDGLGEGQSIGKRIMGIRVIDDQSGMGCSLKESFERNLLFVGAAIFVSFPLLWIFLAFVVIPLLAFEIYLLFALETGVRLGDVIANTLVTENLEDQTGYFPTEK